jgi:Transcription elongation factor, GreA/GreB, C-term
LANQSCLVLKGYASHRANVDDSGRVTGNSHLDRGYISWRSPLANALMKASPGDRVGLRAPAKTEHLEIIDVEYAPIPMDPFCEPLGAQSTPKAERS